MNSPMEYRLQFHSGLPDSSGDGPFLFLAQDGTIHAGELLWIDNPLNEQGTSRVVRTTNPSGGIHSMFDIPVSRIIGHAYAGPRQLNPTQDEPS